MITLINLANLPPELAFQSVLSWSRHNNSRIAFTLHTNNPSLAYYISDFQLHYEVWALYSTQIVPQNAGACRLDHNAGLLHPKVKSVVSQKRAKNPHADRAKFDPSIHRDYAESEIMWGCTKKMLFLPVFNIRRYLWGFEYLGGKNGQPDRKMNEIISPHSFFRRVAHFFSTQIFKTP